MKIIKETREVMTNAGRIVADVLVIVDMQVDFLTGTLANVNAKEVIKANLEVLKDFCRNASHERPLYVILTKDTHSKGYLDTLEGKKLPVEHCIEGTDGWEIIQDILDILDEYKDNEAIKVYVCCKPTFGSLELQNLLGEIEKEHEMELYFTGVCTDICVISNVLMTRAQFPDKVIKVIKKATYGVSEETTEAAFKVMVACQVDVVE